MIANNKFGTGNVLNNYKKDFWINTCFVNLVIVAILGFVLRSKIVFSIPFLDFKNILNAHSHYAFSGWVGLCIMTLFIFNLLPASLSQKKIYQWILAGVQLSSVGMLISFPMQGYAAVSIFFSTAFIFATYVFAWFFIKDIIKAKPQWVIRLLSICAIVSLVISSIGPFGLAYIVASKSPNHVLYRDLIYTFLHFQYNGFFTLSVFALFFQFIIKKGFFVNANVRKFSILLCLSVVPSLFLSLLWHNNHLFFALGIIACCLLAGSLWFFVKQVRVLMKIENFQFSIAHKLCWFSFLSFILKMVLMTGTIFPVVGHAVFGDRPIIIGFLHLVFLGLVTLYLFMHLIEENYFSKAGRVIQYPFIVFTIGIFANEILLMIQGLGILFMINSLWYSWLLWGVSIVLVMGAVFILQSRIKIGNANLAKEKSHG